MSTTNFETPSGKQTLMEYARWLAEMMPAMGDYGKDCTRTLRMMADRIESLERDLAALRAALQEVVDVLGPTPGCSENTCEGCLYEMGHALRVARAALTEETER